MAIATKDDRVTFGGNIPKLSFFSILNMCIGFLGIQFAWSIQMGQMSGLYERLGATPQQVSWFWIAGPITGIIVQPIIGALSDRTWGWLGRRRPYFLVGAVLSSLALLAMPNSPALWVAASLLWILDASINISMQPFRALVADVTPEEQRGTAYSFQSFAIGVGSVLSFGIGGVVIFDWITKNFGQSGNSFVEFIKPFCPTSLHALFYIGVFILITSILWTVFTTKEYPPADIEAFKAKTKKDSKLTSWFVDTWHAVLHMPDKMRKICLVNALSWFAFFCMFIFFSTMVAHNLFKAEPNTPAYDSGIAWASLCYLALNVMCFVVSPLIGYLTKVYRKKSILAVCLGIGGLALVSMYFIKTPVQAMIAMGAIGISWAATLSLPYALLSDVIPQERYGVYMGTFNLFICIPQIICSLFVGPIVGWVGGNQAIALVLGGVSMLLAVVALKRVYEAKVVRSRGKEANVVADGELEAIQ